MQRWVLISPCPKITKPFKYLALQTIVFLCPSLEGSQHLPYESSSKKRFWKKCTFILKHHE